jgi:hypothetical protein
MILRLLFSLMVLFFSNSTFASSISHKIHIAFQDDSKQIISQSFDCTAQSCQFPLTYNDRRVIVLGEFENDDLILTFKDNSGTSFWIGGGEKTDYRIDTLNKQKTHVIDLYNPALLKSNNSMVSNLVFRRSNQFVMSLSIFIE